MCELLWFFLRQIKYMNTTAMMVTRSRIIKIDETIEARMMIVLSSIDITVVEGLVVEVVLVVVTVIEAGIVVVAAVVLVQQQ